LRIPTLHKLISAILHSLQFYGANRHSYNQILFKAWQPVRSAKARRYFFSFVLLILCFPAIAQYLYINEIMSSNATTFTDEDGDYVDWIELYNDSGAPINLTGYHITDNPGNPQKWTFPEVTIDSFLVVFASGKDRIFGPNLHTNFSISIDGEPILLSSPEGDLVDYLPNVVLQTDISFGRIPDGESEMILFSESTPGATNLGGVAHSPLTDVISFSAEQGLYESAFELYLDNNNPNASIHYTLNGSDPQPSSLQYNGAIGITDNADLPNNISMIPTNAPGAYGDAGWQPPVGNVYKGTVLKVQSFENGQPASPVYTKSYFVHSDIYTRYNNLPIISIVTDSLNLFDYGEGIYVPGITFDENPDLSAHWGYGNFNMRGKEWERPAHIALFESDGSFGFAQNIGLRIHGGGTRQFPLKALRIYARNEYGKNTIDYPVFPWKEHQDYKRLLLRPSGNDWRHNFCSDGLSSLLIEDLNIQKQEYRPAVVFINGEFWGLHNIRDRIDKYFMAYTAGANLDEVEIIKNWSEPVEGNLDAYKNLADYISVNDLIYNPYYEYVTTQIDINNVIDYFIARQYTAVKDWPGNNISFWRPTDSDGPWQWIFYDNDKALTDSDFESINHSLHASAEDPSWFHNETHVFLFSNLFRNHNFREEYKTRLFYHLENSFKPERVHHLLDSIVGMIGPVMPEHIARWQFPESLEYWESQIDIVRDFADERPCKIIEHLFNHMDIEVSEIPPGLCDSLSVNSVRPTTYKLIKIWPNPTTEFLNVRFVQPVSQIQSVRVFDISGRTALNIPLSHASSHEILQLKLSALSHGSYILEIRTEEQVYHERFQLISAPFR